MPRLRFQNLLCIEHFALALAASAAWSAWPAESAAPDTPQGLPHGVVAALMPPNERPTSVAFSPDGKLVALGSADKKIHLFDAATGKLKALFDAQEDSVYDVKFSPDGKHLASAGENAAQLWDLDTQKKVRSFEGHAGTVKSVAFSPEGSWLVTSSDDATLKLWDAEAGKEVRTFAGHEANVDSVAFSRDGRTLLSEAADTSARLWDAATGREIKKLTMRDGDVAALDLSPNGRMGITTRGNQTWHVFEVPSGEDLLVLRGQQANGCCAQFAPDSRSVFTGARDGSVREWDLFSGQEKRRFLSGGPRIEDIAVDPAGKRLVTCTLERKIYLWDLSRPPANPAPLGGRPEKLSREYLENSWRLLGDESYDERTGALWRLLEGGPPAEEFLIKKVPPAVAAKNSRIETLIEQLDDNNYGAREHASLALRKMGLTVFPYLREALDHPSPEVRKRALEILREPPADAIRLILAVEVLGWMNTPGATAHLQAVAAGERGHPLTMAAQAVLERK